MINGKLKRFGNPNQCIKIGLRFPSLIALQGVFPYIYFPRKLCLRKRLLKAKKFEIFPEKGHVIRLVGDGLRMIEERARITGFLGKMERCDLIVLTFL